MMDITLRLVTKEDAPQVRHLIAKNKVRLRRYLPQTAGAGKNLTAAQRFVEEKIRQALRRELFYFVLVRNQQEIIGNITVKNIEWTVPKGELSYFIDQDYEGKGYISLALHWVVKHCFETLALEKLYVRIAPDNIPSKKVVRKHGFSREGLLRQEYRTGEGALVDVEYYGLLRSDYAHRPKRAAEY